MSLDPSSCCSEYYVFINENPSADKQMLIVPNTCRKLFCKKCYDTKRKRALKMLYKRDIRSKRLIHADVGIVVDSLGEVPDAKKYLQEVLTKFHSELRDNGYLLRALRVFDMAHNESRGTYFPHFHYAIIPEKNANLKYTNREGISYMNRVISRISNNKIKFFKVEGWKKKHILFSYFAKRMAGYFGHKKYGNNFFLEDVMSYEESEEIFKYMKKLVPIAPHAVGISCIMGKVSFINGKVVIGIEVNKWIFSGILVKWLKEKLPPDGFSDLYKGLDWLRKQDYRSVNQDGECLIEQMNEIDWYYEHTNKKIQIGDQKWLDNYLGGGWGEYMNPEEPLTTIHEEMKQDAMI